SSRRRHTRSKRDWSSDVCSSDLIDISDAINVHFLIDTAIFSVIVHQVNEFISKRTCFDISVFILCYVYSRKNMAQNNSQTNNKQIGRASCRERAKKREEEK